MREKGPDAGPYSQQQEEKRKTPVSKKKYKTQRKAMSLKIRKNVF